MFISNVVLIQFNMFSSLIYDKFFDQSNITYIIVE